MNVESLKAVITQAAAAEQTTIELCASVRNALVKFEGKQITRRMARAVELAFPGAAVIYTLDVFYVKIEIWGGTTGRVMADRFTVYFGGYQQPNFSLAVFDEKNAGSGTAANARQAARVALVNRPELLQAVCNAAAAVKQANAALADAIKGLDCFASVSYGIENAVEKFIKS